MWGVPIAAVLLCSQAAWADAVIVGPWSLGPVGEIALAYDTASPLVVYGSPGEGVPLEYDVEASPLAKVFTVSNPMYHHVNIIEHWVVSGDDIFDWHEMLMVPDGTGGWLLSDNDDDLWWSCYYTGTPPITPRPVVTPEPTAIVVQNKPVDLLSIVWTDGLPAGTQVTVNRWVTVPAGMTEFAIFHFSESVIAVPEPATMALVGFGLGALAFNRRRRRAA